MRPANPIGKPFIELGEVDSTNNHAMRQVQSQMAEHGATYFASYQYLGKGQRGKTWTAARGQNIMLSVVLKPQPLSLENQFLLTMAMALGCYDFFAKYAVDDTSIKWANDIYWKDRKAGGLLIENIIQGNEWKHTVVGIGININQTLFPQTLKNPVSLKQITGKTFDVIKLAKQLCKCLNGRWQCLSRDQHLEIVDDYNAHLYKRNQHVNLIKDHKPFTASVKGVNEQGELIVDDNQRITFGSVDWQFP